MKTKTSILIFIPAGLLILTCLCCDIRHNISEKLDIHMTLFYDYGLFQGSALTAEGNTVIYSRGFGQESLESARLHTPSSTFRIGTLSRMFTIAMILQMIDEGKLALSSTVSELVPDLKVQYADKITLQDLLYQTSGLRDIKRSLAYLDTEDRIYRINDVVSMLAQLPHEFAPGEEYRESSSNMAVVQKIIEKKTGLSFEENLKERIIKPLNLQHTFLSYTSASSTGHVRTLKGKAPFQSDDQFLIPAENGLCSSTEDMFSFFRGVKEFRILSPGMAAMFLKHNRFRQSVWGSFYNGPLGMDIMYVDSRENGYHCQLFYLLSSDDLIILLTNLDSARPLDYEIVNGILSIIMKLPESSISIPEEPLVIRMRQQLEKEYSHGIISFIEIHKDNLTPRELAETCRLIRECGSEKFHLEIVNKAAKLYPDSPQINAELAWACFNNGYLEAADYIANQLLKTDSWNREMVRLARAIINKKREVGYDQQ